MLLMMMETLFEDGGNGAFVGATVTLMCVILWCAFIIDH